MDKIVKLTPLAYTLIGGGADHSKTVVGEVGDESVIGDKGNNLLSRGAGIGRLLKTRRWRYGDFRRLAANDSARRVAT